MFRYFVCFLSVFAASEIRAGVIQIEQQFQEESFPRANYTIRYDAETEEAQAVHFSMAFESNSLFGFGDQVSGHVRSADDYEVTIGIIYFGSGVQMPQTLLYMPL